MALALQTSIPRSSIGAAQVVVRAALRSPTHSHQNRRVARDLVWGWVGEKWPALMPSRPQLESGDVTCVLQGRQLNASTSEDGSTWTLEVSYSGRDGVTWITRAVVSDLGDADGFALQTSCAHLHGPRRIAPPKVLGRWVQRLRLEDAGVAVRGEARTVAGQQDLAALCDHLLASDRMLPVIVLANKGTSRYYGVDPRGLAESVCGLAHVVCLPPELVGAFTERFGRSLAPLAGAVRIYMPGFTSTATSRDHPLMQLPASAEIGESAPDAGAFRRFVCQRVCEFSVLGAEGV